MDEDPLGREFQQQYNKMLAPMPTENPPVKIIKSSIPAIADSGLVEYVEIAKARLESDKQERLL